ncbi:hypothetical protein BpHYR1_031294 [Brachionus plicatilis]|uniref:Uncharacterized protein n=1 Tax=Brachionus plicatilis TaxID=10195 RepID=A0A3M7QIA8_BRAPC|nr:hypothetical protein BpHYR1_031294 [Brachionus plicatilis]
MTVTPGQKVSIDQKIYFLLLNLFRVLESTSNRLCQIRSARIAEFKLGIKVLFVCRFQDRRTIIKHSTATINIITAFAAKIKIIISNFFSNYGKLKFQKINNLINILCLIMLIFFSLKLDMTCQD